MAHAEICPVCKGSGKIVVYPDSGSTSASPNVFSCHGCDGTGWITIQDPPLFKPPDTLARGRTPEYKWE